MSLAVVTLKKGEGRTIKAGGAWIFDNEIESINKMISKAFMSRDFDTVRIAQKALSDIKLNTITMKDY
mgnify:CR=1 FL=1